MNSSPERRGIVAILERGGKVLVIQRSLTLARAPGKFCFPGGMVEPGEEEPTTVVREMQEELGVDVDPVRRVWQSVTVTGVQLGWWYALLPPAAQLQPNPNEVAWCDWLSWDSMLALPDLIPTNRDFVHAYRRGELLLPAGWGVSD